MLPVRPFDIRWEASGAVQIPCSLKRVLGGTARERNHGFVGRNGEMRGGAGGGTPTSPGRPAVRGFLCVPSMNDSLEVEVLYPA
jgi:hypothetical protein